MTDDDRAGMLLTAEEFTVHAREKISTGDYENAEFHTTVSGSVSGHRLDDQTRLELKARLLSLEKEIQETVERAAKNRIREPEHEDWGVRNAD